MGLVVLSARWFVHFLDEVDIPVIVVQRQVLWVQTVQYSVWIFTDPVLGQGCLVRFVQRQVWRLVVIGGFKEFWLRALWCVRSGVSSSFLFFDRPVVDRQAELKDVSVLRAVQLWTPWRFHRCSFWTIVSARCCGEALGASTVAVFDEVGMPVVVQPFALQGGHRERRSTGTEAWHQRRGGSCREF